MPSVLVAEPEPQLFELLRPHLRPEGHILRWVGSGAAVLEQAQQSMPDLLILSVRLPEADGLEVCRRLRLESDLPIILVSSRDDALTAADGLELGADDFVTAPIGARELVARIHALLRRSQRPVAHVMGGILNVGDLRVDPHGYVATLRGHTLDLQPQEFRVLLVLARSPGSAFKRERLLQLAWGRTVEHGTVDVHISWLRAKLRDSNVRIENLRGQGFRLVTLPSQVHVPYERPPQKPSNWWTESPPNFES